MTLKEWAGLEITQEFILEFKDRIKDLSEALVTSAGVDPRYDAYRSGAIAACKDVVNFHEKEESQ